MRVQLGAIVLILTLLQSDVRASENLVEEVFVSGSRLPQTTTGLSSSSVIDRVQIEASNYADVTESLRAVPGLTLVRQGGAGGAVSAYLRGGEANFTPVMINGVQVNDPGNTRGGAYDFSNIDINSIERIEVVRGTHSALYGSDALSGLINIVTKQGAVSDQLELGAGMNSESGKNFGFRSGFSTAEIDYDLGARYEDAGDPVRGYSLKAKYLDASFTTSEPEDYRLLGFLRIADMERTAYPEDSGGPELAVIDALDHGEAFEATLGLNSRYQLNNGQTLHSMLGWHRIDDDIVSPGIAPFDQVPPNASDSEFNRVSASAWLTSQTGALNYTFGGDFRKEIGTSTGYVEFFGSRIPSEYDLNRSLPAVFVEVQTQPNELALNASIRWDGADEFASETSYKVGVAYTFGSGQTNVSLNWGEGFKLPSFFALGNSLVGNPGLKPERSEGYDVMLAHSFDTLATNVTVAYFDNDYEDLIDFDSALFININRSEVSTSGVEGTLELTVVPKAKLRTYFTYTDVDAESGIRLRGRPEWQAGAHFDIGFTDKSSLYFDYRWVNEILQSSLVAGPTLLDEYEVVNIGYRHQIGDKFSLTASLDNLFDERYYEAVGVPAPRRMFRLDFKYRLSKG